LLLLFDYFSDDDTIFCLLLILHHITVHTPFPLPGTTGNSMETPSAALRDARMRLVCTEVFTYHSVVITRFNSSWVDDLIVSSVMPCVELR